MKCFYLTDSQIKDAEKLLSSHGLNIDASYQSFFGLFDNTELIACGARDRNVLKMIAVREDYHSTSAFSEIVNELIQDGFNNGFDHMFVFTKPIYYTNFEYLNFSPLCVSENVAVMEFGRNIDDYIQRHKFLIRKGENSAMVMNCNPFTKGHKYLAEYASDHSDNVYIFVVEEDKSLIPFIDRVKLVKEGVSHLRNVTVLPAGPYAVSSITFPSYFLKEEEKVMACQMQIDLQIFCEKIAPAFGIIKRFAGEEPICGFTAKYNEAMLKILPEYGIEPVQIKRKTNDENIISASKVRELLFESKFPEMKEYVPSNTYEYLTGNIEMLRNRAKHTNRRHG